MSASLDAATLPLNGRHLIEASAGTGKTFTVANLYLRLLIDETNAEPPTVEDILVVTFTNAATEELRARLRSRIALGLRVLNGELPEDADPTLLAVLAPHLSRPATKERLELAYHCMDQAAIFTIHGFCDRVLREQAFESGELFDAELQAEVDSLKLKAAQAWWRDNITPMSADETECIPSAWRSPAAVLNRLAPVITDPAGQIVPQFSAAELQQSQVNVNALFTATQAAWSAEGSSWVDQILEGVQSKLLKIGSGYTAENVRRAAGVAVEMLQYKTAPPTIDTALALLGNDKLLDGKNKVKKNQQAPQSDLGRCIEELVGAYNQLRFRKLVALQCDAKAIISSDLAQRKLLARQRTFDDLLLQLHAALTGENGERLTRVLRQRYQVALIDEFQDTDRIQYEIFDTLFPQESESSAALYLIGDPKQSIYRFRGADINVYLRARESADQQHTLDNNWRSSKRLINALNVLYEQSARPFGAADIAYLPVTAGGTAEGRGLKVGSKELPPLQFDCVDVERDLLPNVPVTINELAQNCACRVAWILSNTTLGSTPVEAKDIAVLVSNHRQGQKIRDALLAVGIGSAMQSRQNVFSSPEALDILALLRVLAHPGESASLSRVLVSPLAGYSADELLRQRDDAVAWQRIEDAVQRCREQCQQSGPQAAVLRFMSLFKSRVNAHRVESSEVRGIDRILGNYLHLADVLQTTWQDHPDLPALLKTAQRWRDQDADEALQLRLESDEALVQIVTVHKAKGLQYPIVMLPFASIGRDPVSRGDAVTFSEVGLPRLDVGSDKLGERKTEATQAEKDESLRTLYVALTRAEQSCWIGVTANKNMKHAALWQMLGVSFPPDIKNTIDSQPLLFAAIDNLANQCADIARSEKAVFQGTLILPTAAEDAPQARTAGRYVQASWRVGSYSALARGATHGVENPDHDAVDVAVQRPETPDYSSPFHFPRGADAGTLVHSVFEHLDFCSTDIQHLNEYADTKLRSYGVNIQWVPALCQLVRNTLDTPLLDNGFSLSKLDNKDRLDELAFHFPVAGLVADKLVALLRAAGVLGAEDDLSFDRLDGYMTGFIDLTFRVDNRWYIADYKSNHLGYDVADYHADALSDAMQHHRYDLQYLIYSVALKRYLTARIPDFDYERDFGGVYYLFVRGMTGAIDNQAPDAKSPTGVYKARPAQELLNELDQLLSGEVQHA